MILKMNDFDYLAHLPGEEQERRWLQERLETLSVREGTILAAATLKDPPEDMAQAINQLQTLDEYTVRMGAVSYEALGMAYLLNETKMPENALPFVDLTQMGKHYEDKHPGLFVGNCYVEYPRSVPQPVYHGQGSPLPEDNDWSVKLKIASPAVPEGVWMCLPDLPNWDDDTFQGESLTLRALHVQHWSECVLLDAQCILPEAGNLMEQYDNLADLLYDGQELGYVLAERGQGSLTFMDRYAAALELEHCRNLRFALDISQNLQCYDWVQCADLETSAEVLLLDAGVSEELIRASGIDLTAYKAHLLEQDGYTPTADGLGYIRRNAKEFHYQYSTPAQPQEEPGMAMQ